jgi:hypothetical protein
MCHGKTNPRHPHPRLQHRNSRCPARRFTKSIHQNQYKRLLPVRRKYHGTTKNIIDAFEKTAKFAQNLHTIGIKNMWAVFVDEDYDDLDKPYKVKDYAFHNPHSEFHIVTPHTDDILLPKIKTPLFASQQEYRPLDHLPETITIDGVHAPACITETVVNGLYSAHARGLKLNIILATDAINCNQRPAEEFLEKVRKAVQTKAPNIDLSPGSDHQLASATTDQIFAHLQTLS